jgi:serine/tyrosine/threonine adenylyltransferase
MSALPASPSDAAAPAAPARLPSAEDWVNRYAQLGSRFHTPLSGDGLPQPHWILHSEDCAQSLGWPSDWWHQHPDALAVFTGTGTWPGMAPVATVYSGHQFGVWAGQLGDGRALLLGEVQTPHGSLEVQLKGAGRTPYSRMGDGRAVLRSSIREFLCSEAMHHLGVPTSRALCLAGSALPVQRERAESAAVVTRVAPSFLRFGHFEHFCHHGDVSSLRTFSDFVLAQYFPECLAAPDPVLAMLAEITQRTARLMAHWQSVGFCHGVMNTDNMSLLGLTLDYGPFGFLDVFDPHHICNHSDEQGRYAFSRQPQVAWWNLHALAQALIPLVGGGQGTEADIEGVRQSLSPYSAVFSSAMTEQMRAKFGLTTTQEGDGELIDDWLRLLQRQRVDYTIAMRRLCEYRPGQEDGVRDVCVDLDHCDAWLERYAARLAAEHSDHDERSVRMKQVNPRVVLRNHLAQTAIERAEAGDFSEVQRLYTVLTRPFDDHSGTDRDAGFPPDWAQHLSVSCSS